MRLFYDIGNCNVGFSEVNVDSFAQPNTRSYGVLPWRDNYTKNHSVLLACILIKFPLPRSSFPLIEVPNIWPSIIMASFIIKFRRACYLCTVIGMSACSLHSKYYLK